MYIFIYMFICIIHIYMFMFVRPGISPSQCTTPRLLGIFWFVRTEARYFARTMHRTRVARYHINTT